MLHEPGLQAARPGADHRNDDAKVELELRTHHEGRSGQDSDDWRSARRTSRARKPIGFELPAETTAQVNACGDCPQCGCPRGLPAIAATTGHARIEIDAYWSHRPAI